jgi:hypothetical protein
MTPDLNDSLDDSWAIEGTIHPECSLSTLRALNLNAPGSGQSSIKMVRNGGNPAAPAARRWRATVLNPWQNHCRRASNKACEMRPTRSK